MEVALASVPSLSPWGPGRRALVGSLVGLCIGGLLLLARSTSAVDTLELRLVDVRTRAFVGDREPDPRIVLAVILDDDHRRLSWSDLAPNEPWPWSLWMHELALRALAAAKVRAVAFDLLLLERGRAPEDVVLPPEKEGQGFLQVLFAEAEQGGQLGAAFASQGRVALAYQLNRDPSTHASPARVEAAEERLCPAMPFEPATGLSRPHADLPMNRPARGAALLAFANVQEDADGVVRRAVPCGWWGERPTVSLPFATALLAADGARAVTGREVRFGDAVQRLDEDGCFFASFRGPARQAYREVSPADLVQWGYWLSEAGARPLPDWPERDRAAFRALEGAIVVYGVNVAGNEDLVTSPISGRLLGPEYQATLVDNLLHGDGRVRVPASVNRLLLLALCALCGAAGSAMRGRWLPNLPPLLLLAGLGLLSWTTFAAGHVVDVLTPAAGLVLTWGGSSVLRLATEGRRNRWLEGTFGRYVSPEIVEALKQDPTLLDLGGRRRDLTVQFSDVAGFTRISESLEPERVVHLLNRYLTTQSEQVMATGGVIDKYIGDAVMAFWGDPIEMPDHALRAVRAALRCLAALPALRPLVEELGLSAFDIRIGLNSGPCVVGNMGSEDRFSYTCMGDTVNLASRLEGANKAFGTRLLVGPLTYLQVKEQVVGKRLADLVVVGKSTPVRVYEVLSLREDADEDTRAHAEAFRQAHEALRRGDLDAAGAGLEEAARRRPGDGPTGWLSALRARMLAGAAPSPWDGTLTLSEK